MHGSIILRMMLASIALFCRALPLVPIIGAPVATGLVTPAAVAASSTLVAVTTTEDRIDGNTSSFDTLLANPGADGHISLREALQAANNTPVGAALTIAFTLAASDPGHASGVWTINLNPALGSLPALTRGNVTINGASQPGAHPSIVLDGGNDERIEDGLVITSSENAIVGLRFRHFYYTGITITKTASDNRISACVFDGSGYDGVALSGAAQTRITGSTFRNNGIGIHLSDGARENRIGGTTPGERNIISGSFYDAGIVIEDATTRYNIVKGNWIGFDSAYTADPNAMAGIYISAASHITIGGSEAGAGNVISGNQSGIRLVNSANITITGNLIGLAPDGRTPLPNRNESRPGQADGILLEQGTTNTTIGGVTDTERNVIAANDGHGIYIYGSSNNQVLGNYIGTDTSGVRAGLGNAGYGIVINYNAQYNTIGGTSSGARNVIVHNGQGGIRVDAPNNHIVGNNIGIGADGTTRLGNQNNGVRISGDGNTLGPGNRIAYSSLSGAVVTGNGTRVSDNTIELNARSGICISGSSATISGNTIRENGGTNGVAAECAVQGGLVITGTVSTPANNNLVNSNTIRTNTGAGVTVWGGSGNRLLGNSISENSTVGILLGQDGNQGVPPPRITQVTDDFIAGQGCPGCRVEIFSDQGDQGAYYTGETQAGPDGAFRLSLVGRDLRGPRVTATVTDSRGNTSPFGPPAWAPGSAPLTSVYLPIVVRQE
jgi:parallel beta-helix repeat protein